MLVLRYGTAATARLPLDADELVAWCDAPRGKPLADLGAAVRAALAEPLDFPPLAQAALPGDKVVLALEHGLPQAPDIVAGTVDVLLQAGVAAHEITVLQAPGERATPRVDPRSALAAGMRDQVAYRLHDPADRSALAYLGAAADARPIYVNRALHDADLVIPIGVLRHAASPGYRGWHSGLFPAFSDTDSLARMRGVRPAEPARHDPPRNLPGEVAWLLGVQFTVQIVPGAASDILHVLAGAVDSVAQAGRRLCNEAWHYAVPETAQLVIATIEGDASVQTWENVARALAAAGAVVDDGGAVVVCSELAEPPGPGVQQLVGAENLHAALRAIGRQQPADALWAAQLVQALDRGPVYLVSRLADEAVEDLGLSPLQGAALAKLAARYGSCLVLANAQHARAQAGETRGDALPAARRKSR